MLASANSVQRHTAVGKPLFPITHANYTSTYRDLPLRELTSIRTFCLSPSTGQYILVGSGTDIYISSDFGRTFTCKQGAISSAGSTPYQSLISDDVLVIVLYGVATNNVLYVSRDGLSTLPITSTSLGTSSTTFTVRAACMSNTGNYIFASGNGSDGGVYVSASGGLFVRKFSNSLVQSCGCSASGLLVVVSLNSGVPKYSVNYGNSFTDIGTTSYGGRKVYVHPDEMYFAMRTDSSFVYVDLTAVDTTKMSDTSPSFSLGTVTSSSVVSNTQANSDFTAVLDRNGRLYYFSKGTTNLNKLCYGNMESGLSTETVVSRFSSLTFSGYKISATNDGKYVLGYTGTTLRLLKQFHSSNTVSFATDPVIGTTGTLNFSWSSASTSPYLALYWTPRTSLSQPQVVSTSSSNVTLTGGSFKYNKSYAFTIVSLTESNGLINGLETKNAANNIDIVTVTGGYTLDTYNSKKRYTFTSNGTFQVAQAATLDVLLVAGGGGGGGSNASGNLDGAGGGGAGEMAYGTLSLNANQTYTITIGAGGTGWTSSVSPTVGQDTTIKLGSNTVAHAKGGGQGGFSSLTTSEKRGSTGGSSGGGCGYSSLSTSLNITQGYLPNTWTRKGNKGGDGPNQAGGGGGGGAGGVGAIGTMTSGGAGGSGFSESTYSTSTFATGGNGGNKNASGNGSSGTANTGNGGGGGSGNQVTNGGSGGSGIAIILV